MFKQTLHTPKNKPTPAIWRLAFRPFFFGGALFSMIALALWGAVLAGKLHFSPYGGALFWHAHEMLFGFGAAIICGFLLTAVQNWTGLRSPHGRALAALFVTWFAARLLMAFNIEGLQWLAVSVDLAFFPILSLVLGRLLIRARAYGNLPMVAVLLLLAFANLATHASVLFSKPQFFAWGAYTAALLIALLITMIGGRVIPMFTANGTQTPMVPALPLLEIATLASTALLVVLFATQLVQVLPDYLMSALFAVAALCQGWRVARWRFRVTRGVPLVWSLHLAYWFIPAGFTFFALHYAGLNISLSAALHGLTAGAMGTIILAMITRVSLGHTGRSFHINRLVALSFALIALAGIARVLGGLFPAVLGIHAYGLAITCWIIAYGIFLINNTKALFTPRPDGGIS